MINKDRLINTFLSLVAIDSPSGGERELCDFIKHELSFFTSDIQEDDSAAKLGGNCGNLIAYIKGTASDRPCIMLNTHMDVIKPCIGVKAIIDGDIIRSDGDTVLGGDDKAGISVILEILRVLKENHLPHGDIQLVFTVSEEVHLMGVHCLDISKIRASFGYTLDCTGPAGHIFTSSPTHDSIVATFTGRAAHAGFEPEKGRNAIQIAARAIARMNIGRIDEETTANIGIISGGFATNIVPPFATIEGEARSHNTEKLDLQIAHMKECINRAADESGASVKIKTQRHYLHYHLPDDSPVVQHAVAAATAAGFEPKILASGGGSDANVFNEKGFTIAPIGTAMQGCHTTQEILSISQLFDVARFALELIRTP